MKKIIVNLCLVLVLSVIPIKYDRDINNEKIISKIDGEKIKYERDINNEKIPVSVGGRKIKYERDINNRKIPVGIEKKK